MTAAGCGGGTDAGAGTGAAVVRYGSYAATGEAMVIELGAGIDASSIAICALRMSSVACTVAESMAGRVGVNTDSGAGCGGICGACGAGYDSGACARGARGAGRV